MATPSAAQEYGEQLRRALRAQFDADSETPDVEGVDLSFCEDTALGLEGLESELETFREHEVVKGILDQGCDLQSYAKEVEEKLRRVELDSIQDYIQESDNLATLHEQALHRTNRTFPCCCLPP